MKSNVTAKAVQRNLVDAGCSAEETELFLRSGREQQLCFLSKHRKKLLELVHRDQHRLECLDYLLYQWKNTAP